MGTGTVVGAVKVVDNGPDTSNWNLVVVGDGYTAGTQQGWFRDWVELFLENLQNTAPFSGVGTWDRINVYQVEVESDESGAINPAVCADGTPAEGGATTGVSYFDAEYCSAGVRRALVVDAAAVMLEVGALVPDWDEIIVSVNHSQDGGSATSIGTSFTSGNADGTAIHELGHLFNLGDEYPYLLGCASGEVGHDVYLGADPTAANLTTNTDRATIKWAPYIDAATPMPTTVNPNPATCDPLLASPVAEGEIGAFDGANHYHSGVYRPAFECTMNESGADAVFCKVCVGAIINEIVVEESTCFLATAVYDDPWAPDVVTLRAWRDAHLAPLAPGRTVMQRLDTVYRTVGPVLARRVRGHDRLTALLRHRVFRPWARLVRRTEETP